MVLTERNVAICVFLQPVLNHFQIFTHINFSLRLNKKHSHKNRTFEIIISTSVSDQMYKVA